MTTWSVGVDWDKTSEFSDIWEDVIQMEWRLGMGKPHQRVADESSCEILLRNQDGKYNPENTSSPLYGKLLPQRMIEIRADDNPMWRGWLDQIQPEWITAGEQTGKTVAKIKGLGAKQLLQDAELILPLQVNKRGDEIIAAVLRRVVLPPATLGGWILGRVGYSELGVTTRLARESDYSDLDEGELVFPYYGDSQEKATSAYQIIKDVTEAERGVFYFGRDGKAVWWNRNRLLDDVLDDATIDTAAGVRPFDLDYQFGTSLANQIQVVVYPRKTGDTITLWTLDKLLTVDVGSQLQFEAPFRDESNQPVGALNVSPIDIEFTSGTGEVSVVLRADRALVTVSNTGTVPAILNNLRLEGQVLSSRNRVVLRSEDLESRKKYGQRGEIRLNLKALEDHNEADTIADLELRRRKDPRGEVRSVTLFNQADGSANASQLNWQIGDRLRVKAPELGHDLAYLILGEQHEVSAGGKVHQTRFILDPLTVVRLAHHPKTAYTSDLDLKQTTFNNTRLAQSFESSVTSFVASVRVWLRKTGNPSGDLTLKICPNHAPGGTWRLGVVGSSELGTTTILAADSDYPDPSPLANGVSQTVQASQLSNGYGWVEFHFEDFPEVEAGEPYWMVLETTDGLSGVNYVQWGADSGSAGMLAERGGSWKRVFCEAIYEVYQGI